MSAERLDVGDMVRCLHCSGWHSATLSSGDCGTDYARRMLFIRCGANVYYIGQAGLPARDPRRVGDLRQSSSDRNS